jgi:serine/threonine protein kinase
MAKLIPIGQPANDSERQALAYLRDHLPDNYTILHNFELKQGDMWFEIDLALIAPHAVYVVDVKSIGGEIHVDGGKWQPEGRAPFNSPLPKLRQNAKVLKSLIVGTPEHAERKRIYVDAVVLMTAPDARLNDPLDRDKPGVCSLVGCERFFQNASRLPFQPPTLTIPHLGAIRQAIQGKARAQSGLPAYGNWRCEERLGSNENFTEYRAYNIYAGPGGGHVLLRAYKADPLLPVADRLAQAKRISNAFRALNQLPSHPAIPGVRDFFPAEGDHLFILVTQDAPGQSLRLHLKKPSLALTLDQKIHVVRDLLSALTHIHSHGVIHRAISPATVILGLDTQTRLVDFDFAKTSGERSATVGKEAVESADQRYLAPEVYADPANASSESDIYSTGAVVYELFTGEPAFRDLTEAIENSAVFLQRPSQHGANVPNGFDDWLQSLCFFAPEKRPTAKGALQSFEALFGPAAGLHESSVGTAEPRPDYKDLPSGFVLRGKYTVEKLLGMPGAFGVAYKVIDTFGDIARVMKIYTGPTDLDSRMRQEYQTLLRIPPHPNVVKVIDGDYLDGGGPPYVVFEYLEGSDLKEQVGNRALSLNDISNVALQVAAGLDHLHRNNAFHLDIKPANLIWTVAGIKIIDFNVAVLAGLPFSSGGGTRKYLPPDLDPTAEPMSQVNSDRDIYALGITLYEAITGSYPWSKSTIPIPGQSASDPRKFEGCEDLSQKLVEVLLRSLAPKRSERFSSAEAFLEAWRAIKQLREPKQQISISSTAASFADVQKPNTNAFVSYLLTLFSQSQRSNAGTRGLDKSAEQIYVDTALDRELAPAVLQGKFRLAIISGNAGDGKTAFLQTIENNARRRGEIVTPLPSGNGSTFKHEGRRFISNYDGSQDEGEKINEAVLLEFFGAFEGNSSAAWPDNETRLVAINEGRLIDFLETNSRRFPHLRSIVRNGLKTSGTEDGVVVINLNLRSVVAKTSEAGDSILSRLVRKLADAKFWTPCHSCDLRKKCYIYHNARTFQDPIGGAQVIERLSTLYTLTTLRGKLHITLRDLRSALAFTLVGTKNCDEVHELYRAGNRSEIARGFYFNSWMGVGNTQQSDRLLALLKEIDVGAVGDPKLDRAFDFRGPDHPAWLLDFEQRVDKYDREILGKLYVDLPTDPIGPGVAERLQLHREYVAMIRRLHFFECRDASWKNLLPYTSGEKMLGLIRGEENLKAAGDRLLRAISRGEGIFDPNRLKGKLALQVRHVEGGTIRSYRVFDGQRFALEVNGLTVPSPYLEHSPTALILRYNDKSSLQAELTIGLDVFEMLERLNRGYRPTVEEIQGYYLSLIVFKNVLGSAPYQEVLLTTTGHEFYSIQRKSQGKLEMYLAEASAEYGTTKER